MRKTLSRTLALAAFLIAASVACAADPAVSGTFMGNGKDGKLAFAIAKKSDPFGGKETVEVTLTEKDTGGNPFKAMFGDFGSALILKIDSAGDIIGCQVVHSAHQKQGFSSLGRIKTENYKLDQGVISAKVTTGGEIDTFGEKWAVDLTFKTPVK
ncbi:MAG TPA: hypothetical protein VLJ37_10855 [bacterium]|nr:hypothetical protein [bacterium]